MELDQMDFRLSSSTVEESSMGVSWAAHELLGPPPWCQLLSEAADDAAAGR